MYLFVELDTDFYHEIQNQGVWIELHKLLVEVFEPLSHKENLCSLQDQRRINIYLVKVLEWGTHSS
jgi:hypothetical protein